MDRDILIAVEHVSRDYDRRRAVDDISFTVQRGEILGFLGPNGAGKTTTMHMICGVLAPTAGTISIAGHDIVEQPKQAKSCIGFLPEQPPLYPDLTVDQYLAYCGHLRGIARGELAAAMNNSRERCGVQDVAGRLIGNLSKGYQQRVGIAQAIIHSPELVILDEPTVGLDPHQIVEIRQLISELGDDHSVILSTHILSEVQSTCDRVLIIHQGHLILDASLDSLAADSSSRGFTAALRQPPAPEELAAVAGVVDVQPVGEKRFRIASDGAAQTPERFAEAAVRGGWGLFELVPEVSTLEETFLRLTRGVDPPDNLDNAA